MVENNMKECPDCGGWGHYDAGEEMLTDCKTCKGTGKKPVDVITLEEAHDRTLAYAREMEQNRKESLLKEISTEEKVPVFTLDELCDYWPELMKMVEGKDGVEELDCGDRYLLKDALTACKERTTLTEGG